MSIPNKIPKKVSNYQIYNKLRKNYQIYKPALRFWLGSNVAEINLSIGART